MSPWVRAYVLAGVEISSQHPLGGFTTIHNASSRGSNTLLTFMGTNHTCDAQTHAGKTLTHRSFFKNVGRPCPPPKKRHYLVPGTWKTVAWGLLRIKSQVPARAPRQGHISARLNSKNQPNKKQYFVIYCYDNLKIWWFGWNTVLNYSNWICFLRIIYKIALKR